MENLLPCPIEFNIWDLRTHQRVNRSTVLIQKGEEHPLHTMKFDPLGITVRVAGKEKSRREAAKNHDDQQTSKEETLLQSILRALLYLNILLVRIRVVEIGTDQRRIDLR